MVSFIDANRDAYGVEPICKLLPIAPSTFYEHMARRANPERRSAPTTEVNRQLLLTDFPGETRGN